MVGADVPHRRLGTARQNQKHALRDIGLCKVFFRELILALPGWTMHNRIAFSGLNRGFAVSNEKRESERFLALNTRHLRREKFG